MRLDVPLRRIALLLVLAVSGAVAAVAAIVPSNEAVLAAGRVATLETLPLAAEGAVQPAPQSYVREERVHAGDTLAVLLARLGIGEADARRLARLREARLLKAGAAVTAEVGAAGELRWLRFPAGRDNEVTVERSGEGFAVAERPAVAETRAELRAAVIVSSLFGATDQAGIPDSVAIQLADVFGGDIDFHRDLRKGDRFSVLYESLHAADGRQLRTGRVLAAEFVNQGKALRAVWFDGGYYAPDGKNLRKAFLRSPLEFSRVSSGFGMRRHPFLQTWRAHQGVDYAAPTGTRVRAVGDGVVEFAGRQGGYGNLVILRHGSSNQTYYAHLHRFGPGIRRGARVAQGDTIGAVGQTGWATGPHLHYEFRVAGTARNPLTLALPAAAPVPAGDMPRFTVHAGPIVAQLDLIAQHHAAQRLASASAFFE